MIRMPVVVHLLVFLLVLTVVLIEEEPLAQSGWKAHDMDRPRPSVMTPPRQELPKPAPAGAIVLFEGGDLSQWESPAGGPPGWIVSDGAMISVAGSGYLQTREVFGDIQLHVEWAAPLPVEGDGQGRGNSGIYLMGRYEVQVLDSYQNLTYADGQAGSVYGQFPPLFNVCRPPGEWQSYDIFFRRPRFSEAGGLLEPARVTLLHNDLLVQNNVELWGPTNWLQSLPYQSHADRLPLALQDHGNPVQYRNIWLRELPEPDIQSGEGSKGPGLRLPTEILDRYVGQYQTEKGATYTLRRDGHELKVHFQGGQFLELVVQSTTRFTFKRTDAVLEFELGADEIPESVTFHIGRSSRLAKRVE